MKTITKALVGTVAAGAMAVSSATPAFARDRHDGGIDAGDVIAGAVILGGIAAVIAATSNKDRGYQYNDRNYRYNDRDYRYNDRHYRSNSRYGQGSPRAAVERCVQAAENNAARSGYRYANVTQIRDVDDTRYGWKVKGNIQVDGQRGYGRYNARNSYDTGSFSCSVSGGRVVDLDFRGVRGLR